MSNNKQTTNNESSEIKLVEYSERSFAIIGDTKPIKDALKKMGGRYNPRLKCGAGWIFSNKSREQVAKYLKSIK